MMNFLYSNLFTSLVTFVVGSFAIGLYIKQKIDQEKDSAKLILQEIRYAEQQIRNFKALGSYSLADKLLPTNSWHKNIHLFVGKLKETEIDLISRFYSNAAYLDVVISKISDKKNEILIPMTFPSTMQGTPPQQSTMQPMPQQPIQIIIPQQEMEMKAFELNSNKILAEVSQKIEFIYNTPAIDKMREIAEKRRWLFF